MIESPQRNQRQMSLKMTNNTEESEEQNNGRDDQEKIDKRNVCETFQEYSWSTKMMTKNPTHA